MGDVIISIRGTNGAGKSTIVRKIMASYDLKIAVQHPGFGTRRPTGYICKGGHTPLFVPGHYEIANGGIDTLPSLDAAYDLARIYSLELGMNVLMEGKNLSDGVTRVLALRDSGCEVAVFWLDFDVEQSIAAVRSRGHKIKKDTIRRIEEKCAIDYDALGQESDIWLASGGREECFSQVSRWLSQA